MSDIVTWGPATDHIGACVVALGVFDGVHVGHQALVADAVSLAESEGACSVVLTFDRDPDQVVSPTTAMPQLLDLEDKLALLADQGAGVVLVVPFTPRLAAMSPLTFLDEVLLATMSPVAVAVGRDFRFGHRAEGDVDVLTRYGAAHGFRVLAHDLVSDDGGPITSTRIRHLVHSGDVAQAAALLGRPHRVRGLVVHGRGAGAAIGFATANLAIDPYAALPAPGVYAGRATIGDTTYPAAISVGRPPTFPEAHDDFEVHAVGYLGDLYGRALAIEFLARLRDQRAFDDAESLAEAVASDIERVREIVSR